MTTRSVLAITSELPWPLNTGGHLRTFHLLRTLARSYHVRLVVPVPPGQEAAMKAVDEHGITVCPVRVPHRTPWREGPRALIAAALGEPYVMFRRHYRHSTRRVLLDEAARRHPDVVYLDHLDSLTFRQFLPAVPAVIDLHNVYSTLLERTAAEHPQAPVRAYLRREARLLRRMEQRAVRETQALLTVSEEEGAYFTELGAQPYLVPNGVDCAAYKALPTGRPATDTPTLLYLGTMSWAPNAQAARYLATEVLPAVRARIPGARVRLIGREPPPELLALHGKDGVEVTGAVPDVVPHLREASLLAVPLESGGGTRLKILEAFAAGLPVVSTPVGCEGIRASHGNHLVVVERGQFADGAVTLLRDPALGARLASRGRELVRARYDWDTVGEVACAAVGDIVARQAACVSR